MSADLYTDDRPGMMRVHIAGQRAELACDRYSRDTLRAHAKAHGVVTAFQQRYKTNLAWWMAQHGLIDADGYLRDGFPDCGSS